MFSPPYTNTRNLEKHYRLDLLKDYYGDDEPSMRVVLKLYLEETPRDIDLIENFLESNDAGHAKAATHKIKTNIAMLGIVDSAGFINAMHLHARDIDVQKEIIILFKLFKNEVMKGLEGIQRDFFSEV